ncbi:hypothetical protein ACP275_07G082300 [Erythranthe tilingii]
MFFFIPKLSHLFGLAHDIICFTYNKSLIYLLAHQTTPYSEIKPNPLIQRKSNFFSSSPRRYAVLRFSSLFFSIAKGDAHFPEHLKGKGVLASKLLVGLIDLQIITFSIFETSNILLF